ncbi:MAG: metallophosphoesterase [Eubacterium sp.]|nr:metallophosphoesterase [Eubacterium sp.]
MKILVVSDTHGYAESIELILPHEGHIDLLIHCGDIEGQADYIRSLVDCPTIMVAGNNDWTMALDKEVTTKIDDYRVWITHGHRYGVSLGMEMLEDEAVSRNVDWCLYGHTHRPRLDTKGHITYFNPGSLAMPRQLGRTPTYGTIVIDQEHEARFSIKELQLKK